jgi:hypothetical protein
MTQRKIERRHQTLKNRIVLENYYLPREREAHVGAFVADCGRFVCAAMRSWSEKESRQNEIFNGSRRICRGRLLERVKGIEPSYAAWEAAVLPLNYTRELLPASCGNPENR